MSLGACFVWGEETAGQTRGSCGSAAVLTDEVPHCGETLTIDLCPKIMVFHGSGATSELSPGVELTLNPLHPSRCDAENFAPVLLKQESMKKIVLSNTLPFPQLGLSPLGDHTLSPTP